MTSPRFKRLIAKKEADYANRTQSFYPHIPSPPLPPSLPLEDYTGTYFHAAYRNITIYLSEEGTLHIKREDVSWKVVIELKHVSGDYFMAYVDSATAPGMIFKEKVAAGFQIGVEGKPEQFGIAVEEEMGVDGRMWFKRVE